MEPSSCIQDLTKHEESLNRFLSDLESREQNFTESLKKIGDTLEAMVNVKSPEIPEFLLRVPSKLVSVKKKINKKRSRSKKRCIDDCTAEFNVFNAIRRSEISEAMDLKDLAKKFKKFLKKAKKQGLSRLIEPIKESARRLRELGQAGCSCEFETTLNTDEQVIKNIESDRRFFDKLQAITKVAQEFKKIFTESIFQRHKIRSSTVPTKICTSNANKETVEPENGAGTPCNCNEWSGYRLNEHGLCMCNTCEEMCNCSEKNLLRAGDTRKRRRRQKPKHEKNNNICPEGRIADHCDCSEDANICEEGKIADNCDCSVDTNICGEGKIAENCDCSEDTTINELQFDINATHEHSIKSESCTHKLLNKREISKSCEDLDFGQCQNDAESLKNDLCILRSLIQNLTTIGKLVVEQDRYKKDSEIPRCIWVEPIIRAQKSDNKILLKIKDDGTNVKDEVCQCIGDAKEIGRTNRSKRRLKDHTVKDKDEASHELNVKRCQTSCGSGHEASRTDIIARSPLTKEIVILKGSCHRSNQSDSDENWDYETYRRTHTQFDLEYPTNILNEKNTCLCGCVMPAEPSDQLYPCSSTKMEKSRKDVVRSLLVINDPLTSVCPCGCADMLQVEGFKMSQVEGNSLLMNEHIRNMTQEKKENIEKLSKKLEGKIHSVKAKNNELKQLMKICYCDKDVDDILTLQCSQPPPIRATRSGLTIAIQVLQSKCHTKDRMITVLASELQGFKNVDQIAKNLTAPCLQFTYWDFDQCNLYSYLQSSNGIKAHTTNEKLVTESPEGEKNQLHQTRNPTNFRIVREICNCLLVSWNIPENITGLKGYEIVINSNIVAARVNNPTRTEAVLGPFDLSESAGCPRSIILTLYAINSHGQYSEASSIKF